MLRSIKRVTLLLLTTVFALPSFANWQLNQENSSINFISVKKEHITENHYFDKFSASISEEGNVNLEIALSSVNTKIDIRNERMKEHLFNVSVTPTATFTTQVNMKEIAQLPVGESKAMQVAGEVNLHGQSQNVTLKALVTKLSNEKILVVSQESLIIKAQDFGLVAGINKLQELAKLPSITHTVPVNFVLTFTH